MVMNLLVFKERLKSFYAKYEIYLTPLGKFLLAAASFLLINQMIGYKDILKNPLVVIGLSILCAFIPGSAIVFMAALYLLIHLYTISLEITIIAAALMLLMFLLYYGIKPGNSIILILTPIAFAFKVPYVIPLCMGLTGSISAIIPVSFGIIMYYLLSYVKQNLNQLASPGSVLEISRYSQIIDSIIKNKMILLLILAFSITTIAVYILRRLKIDYAWSIAICIGAIVEISILLIGDFVFAVSIPMGEFLFGMLASILIAFIIQFFVFAVDYTRTEYTQFEDDEYYYYVKAVPKIVVTTPQVTVRRFTSKKKKNKG